MNVHFILDNIRSAYNVGSIFRTSDGAGIEQIHICGYTPTPENPKVLKTSLKSEGSIKWDHYEDINECISTLKKDGYKILAIEVDKNAQKHNEYDYPDKVALILGNEKIGISKEILSNSDDIIMIDMRGKKTSLNVAVTAGIIGYSVTEYLLSKLK